LSQVDRTCLWQVSIVSCPFSISVVSDKNAASCTENSCLEAKVNEAKRITCFGVHDKGVRVLVRRVLCYLNIAGLVLLVPLISSAINTPCNIAGLVLLVPLMAMGKS
jgi:hypothetical protein